MQYSHFMLSNFINFITNQKSAMITGINSTYDHNRNIDWMIRLLFDTKTVLHWLPVKTEKSDSRVTV